MEEKNNARNCVSQLENYQQNLQTEIQELNKEIEEHKHNRMKYCSYINSYKINASMRKYSPEDTNKNIHMTNMENINTLISLHLKRLNVKTKNKKDCEISGLDLFSRQSENYNLFGIPELREKSKSIIKDFVKLKNTKINVGTTLNKEKGESRIADIFARKIGKNRAVLKQKFDLILRKENNYKKGKNKHIKVMASYCAPIEKRKEYWIRTIEKQCENQLYLNESIDSVYFVI